MNILFLGIFQQMNGARSVTERNLEKLIQCVGEESVHSIALIDEIGVKQELIKKYKNIDVFMAFNSKLEKLKNLLLGSYPLINGNIEKFILEKIEKDKIDIVFIDSAILWNVVKKIKNKDSKIKIITFFHDINVHLANNYLKNKSSNLKFVKEYFKKMPFLKVSISNEKKSIKYSDKIIVLNDRDCNVLKESYEINCPVCIIPISLKDRFTYEKARKVQSNELELLFVGIAKHLPNLSGIVWFIKNVIEELECELTIIGRGMEDLKSEIYTGNQLIDKKIKLLGTVEDIDEYYYKSDLVITPIFEGGGMKVKTAEALMFGKFIIGSKESFEGYTLIDKVNCNICENKEEFIRAINNFKKNNNSPFNNLNREKFKNEYSNDVIEERFKKIISF